MPRGISRDKHPELYEGKMNTKSSGKTGRKNVGSQRKTAAVGGRTNRSAMNAGDQNGRFGDLQVLANIRGSLATAEPTAVNPNLLQKIDQLILTEIERITPQAEVKENIDTRRDAAVVERNEQVPQQFNPPGPTPQPGGFQPTVRS